MDEGEFVEGLAFEDLRERYVQERERRLQEARESFGKDEGTKLRRDLEAGIEDDRRHREVLNLALNLFTRPTSGPYRLGYRFVRGSPLHELGVPNFDFLVANLDAEAPVAILGEAKGSVSSPTKAVARVREREKAARDNMDHIKRRYLRTDVDPRVEVVLVVPAISAQRVVEAIEDSGGGIIPWMTDTGENLVNLELPRSIRGKARGTMTHSDRHLNKALERARSADRGFDIFPQSPPFTKLRMLVVHARREGQRYWVDRDILYERLRTELFYLDDDEVSGLADEVLRMGFEAGVLKEVEGRAALSMRWGDRASMEVELRKAWVDHRCGHELQRRLDATVAELHGSYEQERDRRPPLESFDGRRSRRTR